MDTREQLIRDIEIANYSDLINILGIYRQKNLFLLDYITKMDMDMVRRQKESEEQIEKLKKSSSADTELDNRKVGK